MASHNCDGIEAGENYNIISLYLASSFLICNQAYSYSFFIFLVTPRSTRNLLSDLFLVKRWIFSSIQANIHQWGNYGSHVCSQPRCGWNQRSHSASFISLSILHQLLSGRNIHQRELCHRDRLYKHRWFFDCLWKPRHSSWLFKIYNN